MAVRDEIATILADGGDDKQGRVTRLKAQRLRTALASNLPFTWQPRANVSVIIKGVSVGGNAIEFVIDLTIRGVTKSLSTWVEGKPSNPDWVVVNPPLFADDPAGDVTIPVIEDGVQVGTRRGRDDITAALRQVFVDTFGDKIRALVLASAP